MKWFPICFAGDETHGLEVGEIALFWTIEDYPVVGVAAPGSDIVVDGQYTVQEFYTHFCKIKEPK